MKAFAEILLLLAALSSTLADKQTKDEPIVSIEHGKIKGKMMTSFKGREFYGFLGVPYAKPPLGELRFKAPQSPDSWNNVLDTIKDGSICPQLNPLADNKVVGNEDCLFLNVFTPKLPGDNLDVMVYIHGGGFTWGDGTTDLYNPSILMDKDIILVVFNYRLGPLGFLSTGDEISPGNNGLKDQLMVLKWVKHNIGFFGGNPNSVTIFGNSAGGGSVNLHVLSPASKGLFHRAISQSGSAYGGWSIGDAVTPSMKLAKYLGCEGSSNEIVSCLRKKETKDLLYGMDKLHEWSVFPIIPLGPCIEKKVAEGEEMFMSENLAQKAIEGRAGELVPMMMGITSEDGNLMMPTLLKPGLLKEFDSNFEKLLDTMFYFSRMVNDTKGLSKRVRKFYYNKKPIDENAVEETIDLLTDGFFLQGLAASAKTQSKYAKTFVYMFTHKGSVSYSSFWGGGDTDFGVTHSDELLYLFNHHVLFPNMEWNKRERKVSDILVELWTNFAKTGNPTPEKSDLLPIEWNPLKENADGLNYLDISESIKMARGLYKHRIRFWEQEFKNTYKTKTIKMKKKSYTKTKTEL